ncbi:MAG: acylphosphatase [Gemmatimonadota bacterium]
MIPVEGRRRVRAAVQGRVQGVGFRIFVRRIARELQLAGWVRNRPDGAVELEAQGSAEAVRAFLSRLGEGPVGARVDALDVADLEGTSEGGAFEIRI